MYNIRITDTKSKYYGLILKGNCIYYDVLHNGTSENLYQVKTKNRTIQFLEHQIDKDYYEKQLLAEIISELGANVGDNVIIQEDGSGSYSKDWDEKDIHRITNIEINGCITFDDGKAIIYKPKVKKIVK